MSIVVLYLVLYILAATCFFLYSVVQLTSRVNLLGLGVFFWALVPLIQTIRQLSS